MKNDGRNARSALLNSFADLATSRRYPDFGVGLIIRKAKVARSTFYYYFKEKDELLLENLRPMISVLARSSLSAAQNPELENWMSHIWDHRGNARRIFEGTPARKIANALAQEIQHQLSSAIVRRRESNLTPLLATQIAGSIMSLLKGWVDGGGTATPSEIAGMIQAGAMALTSQYINPAPAAIPEDYTRRLIEARLG